MKLLACTTFVVPVLEYEIAILELYTKIKHQWSENDEARSRDLHLTNVTEQVFSATRLLNTLMARTLIFFHKKADFKNEHVGYERLKLLKCLYSKENSKTTLSADLDKYLPERGEGSANI